MMILFLELNKEWMIKNFDKIKLSCVFLFFLLVALIVWEIMQMRLGRKRNITFLKESAKISPVAASVQGVVEKSQVAEDIFKNFLKTGDAPEPSKISKLTEEQKEEKVVVEREKSIEPQKEPERAIEEDPWQKLIKESVSSRKQRSIKLEDDNTEGGS